jgi:hypothetical protein
MILLTYADEIGIHDTAEICSVVGLRADVRRWSDFETGWRAVLKKYAVDHFHALNFFRTPRRGEFQRFLPSCTPILQHRRLRSKCLPSTRTSMAVIVPSLVISVTAVAVESTTVRQDCGGDNQLIQECK